MSRRHRARSAALDPAGDEDMMMVRALNPEHDRMIADGYALCRSSRIWLRENRTYTLRLVYRHRSPAGRFFDCISYVMRGSIA